MRHNQRTASKPVKSITVNINRLIAYAATVFTIAILGCTYGCSKQQVFEGFKAKNRNDCYNLPESQQDDCLKAADVSFEEYQRQRKETEESELNQNK